MIVHGQPRDVPRNLRSECGYAMAALLVALAVMAVLMTVAMPVWRTASKREREEELIWRGTQYARAVALFRRKYANASPPNLDILLTERFLRKKYKDPFTKDGEFQLVYATDQQLRAGQIGPGQTSPESRQTAPGAPPRPSPFDSQQGVPAGARGGIVGVVSKSNEKSLRIFNGRTKYNEWSFTPETVGLKTAGGPNAPGNVPGGIGPDGRPAPARGQINLDRFGRPTTSPTQGQQPGQPPPRPFGLPPRPPQ